VKTIPEQICDILENQVDDLQIILSITQNTHRENVPLTIKECSNIEGRIHQVDKGNKKIHTLIKALALVGIQPREPNT